MYNLVAWSPASNWSLISQERERDIYITQVHARYRKAFCFRRRGLKSEEMDFICKYKGHGKVQAAAPCDRADSDLMLYDSKQIFISILSDN